MKHYIIENKKIVRSKSKVIEKGVEHIVLQKKKNKVDKGIGCVDSEGNKCDYVIIK